MALFCDFKQPLHKGLLTFNDEILKVQANIHSLDYQKLQRTMSVLVEFNSKGNQISCLQAAIMTEDYKICKRLISEGADFISHSPNVVPPLNIALNRGKYQLARLLITNGASVHLPVNGFYPMYFAITPQSPEFIVEVIISAGFSPSSVIETLYQSTALHKAVACNNIPVVRLLLKNKINCNDAHYDMGFTPMHIAVKGKNHEIVKLLAEFGANLEIESAEGLTPVFYAIQNNDLPCLKLLVELGANVNHFSSEKDLYPINLAVIMCRSEITTFLIEQGADLKLITQQFGNTPLHSAAWIQNGILSEKGSKELESITKQLIENGVIIDLPNKHGYTPLQLAVLETNCSALEVLVRKGASVRNKLYKTTDFHLVAHRASSHIVKVFHEFGADYAVGDSNQVTPYHAAVENPDTNVLRVFWKFYCPYDLPNPASTVLMSSKVEALMEQQELLTTGIRKNDEGLILYTLGNGAEPKGCSKELPYPLHYVSFNGFTSVVQILLDHGVPPNWVDDEGNTPLHIAASQGHYDICHCLLKYGAVYNPYSKTNRKTPLDLARENNHHDVIKLLKDINKNFKLIEKKKNVKKLAERFRESKCDLNNMLVFVNCVNRSGETLLSVALKKGFINIANNIMVFRLSN